MTVAWYEQELLNLINGSRAQYGLSPLKLNEKLDDAADGHTEWMLDVDRFSHTGEGGSSPFQRIKAEGYDYRSAGENIAWRTYGSTFDSADIKAVHTQLMNSSGHRANILNSKFTEIGLGIETGDYRGYKALMVTENFASPLYPTKSETQPANSDLKLKFHEDFSDGTGIFKGRWGDVQTGNGEVKLTSRSGEWKDSGIITQNWNNNTPFGYGLYEAKIKANKDTAGVYMNLWPADDKWPGSEIDIMEIMTNGTEYGTVHWNNNGSDAYKSVYNSKYTDATQYHTYSVMWQPDKLEWFIDGRSIGSITSNVPKAHEDGGVDMEPSFGVQTWWNTKYQNGTDFTATITDFKYYEIA